MRSARPQFGLIKVKHNWDVLQKLPKVKLDCILNVLLLPVYIPHDFKPTINRGENTIAYFYGSHILLFSLALPYILT